jgi:hypothetical protein
MARKPPPMNTPYDTESVGEVLANVVPGRLLSLAMVSMFNGDPGCGKTMIALDLAARITTRCAAAR